MRRMLLVVMLPALLAPAPVPSTRDVIFLRSRVYFDRRPDGEDLRA